MRPLLALLLAFSVHASTLGPYEQREGEVQPGATETLAIALHAGDAVRVSVREKGEGLAVSIHDPAGQLVAGPAGPIFALPVTQLSAVAEEDGLYVLELRALKNNKAAAKYVATVDDLRSATAEDRKRFAAECMIFAGEALRAGDGAESLRAAAAQYEDAVRLLDDAGNRDLLAKAEHLCGLVHDYLNELAASAAWYERAVAIRREDGDRRGEGESLANLAPVYRQRGEMAKAREALERAIELLRGSDDPRSESTAYHNMGTLQWYLGSFPKAIEAYSEAARIRRAAGMRAGEAESLTAAAAAYRNLGESQKALQMLSDALAVKRELGDRRGQMTTLHNMSVAYSVLGQFAKTIELSNEALAIARELGDRQWQSSTLLARGIAHRSLGNDEQAMAAFRESLELRTAVGDRRGQAEVLSNLGLLHEMRGDARAALALYERALPLHRELQDRRGAGFTAANLGSVHAKLGHTAKAAELLAEALQIQRAIGDENGVAQTLLIRARMHRDAGELAEARAAIDEAIAAVESLRGRVGLPSLRSSYRALKEDHYTLQVDILMRLHARDPRGGYDGEALLASERARARTMREALAVGNVMKLPGVAPELLAQRRAIQQQLNAKERARIGLAANDKQEPAAALEKEIRQLVDAYETVEARIRASSPQYASLTQAPALTLNGLRRHLGDGTALLVYSLGDERSYAWVLTRTALHAAVLPGREEIERSARRVYELVSAGRRRETEVPLRRAIAALSALIVGPLQSHLRTTRLAIVADGALQYVPFAALTTTRPDARPQPLLARHEIVSLPSASLLDVLRARDGRRGGARRAIAVFADPVLEPTDPRLRRRSPQIASMHPPAVQADLLRSGEQSGVPRFQRLAYTGLEADAIVGLADEARSLKATGLRATRAAVLHADLRRFSILHFATHGLLNNESPELSGIVLSLVNERGEPQDGFLRAHEICGLDLDAELVVVSACRTALGKDIRGEGLVGITRAFMLAGAARVMASLWDVRDQATAELMKRFYRGIFEKDLSPPAALRAAQLSMRGEPRWQSPFYWAPFVIQGDWR